MYSADDDFDDNLGLADAVDAAINAPGPKPSGGYAAAPFQQNVQQGFDASGGYPNAPYQQNAQQGFDHAQQGSSGQQQPTSPGGVQPPEILNCHCGLQCSYIMAKTQKNDGRWFYR